MFTVLNCDFFAKNKFSQIRTLPHFPISPNVHFIKISAKKTAFFNAVSDFSCLTKQIEQKSKDFSSYDLCSIAFYLCYETFD